MKKVQKNYFLIFVASIVIFVVGSIIVDVNKEKEEENEFNIRVEKRIVNEKIYMNALNEAGIDTTEYKLYNYNKRKYFSSPFYMAFNEIENKENFIFPDIWVKQLKDSLDKYKIENTTKKVIENYNLNNPQSISSVFDNDKIIKDLGLDVNDLKSTDGKLNFSKGDGYSSGHPNGSEEQLYYYAGKLSSYLYKSGKVEKVAKYVEKNYQKKLKVWDANEYHSAWILKNNPHLWKFINDL